MSQDHQAEYARYTRLSKGRAGISRQKTLTGRHVDKLGGRIVADFSDADQTAYAKPGAAKPKRDDFTAMLAMLRASPGLHVVAWHADRLSRNPEDAEELIKVCAAGGNPCGNPFGRQL